MNVNRFFKEGRNLKMSTMSVGTEFDAAHANCCVSCCKPCRICLAPISQKCRTDHLFFRLHGMPWKTAYGKPAGFFRCCSPLVFLLTRIALLVFWLAISLWSLAADANAKWITFLTHWTLLLELIYLSFAVFSTYMAIYDTKVPDGVGEATPWFISVTYALQPMVLIASLLVFLMYWALVYTPPLRALSVMTHGSNFVVMLIDLLLVRNPMYLSHVLMRKPRHSPATSRRRARPHLSACFNWRGPAMAYAIVYLIFSVIYWAATGENIYDALDWGNPSGAGKLSALILFVGLPFLWILLYCVFLGRRCHRVATSESGKLPV